MSLATDLNPVQTDLAVVSAALRQARVKLDSLALAETSAATAGLIRDYADSLSKILNRVEITDRKLRGLTAPPAPAQAAR